MTRIGDETGLRHGSSHYREVGTMVFVVLVLVAAWELTARLEWVSSLVLPAPSLIAAELWVALVEIVTGGPMLRHTMVTLGEILAGFLIAVVAGMLLGIFIAESAAARRTLMPYLVALNAAPKIAFAPLLAVWFGFGMNSKIVMAALIAFFPLLVNVVSGIATVDDAKLKLMRSLAASRLTTLVKVKLPDAMPMILAGVKTAIVLAVVGAVVGEFVAADVGLGYVIKQTEYQLDVARTFAVILILSGIGIALFYAVELVEKRLLFWTKPRF